MSSKNDEQVLVTVNHPTIHPPNQASPYHFNQNYIHLKPHDPNWEKFVIENASFVDRWLAERDASIVQLIPYVICCTHDGRILSYQRSGGGEDRLERKLSIGIGGHVNDTDIPATKTKPVHYLTWETILNGAAREICEELSIDNRTVKSKLHEIGLIYTPMEGRETRKMHELCVIDEWT